MRAQTIGLWAMAAAAAVAAVRDPCEDGLGRGGWETSYTATATRDVARAAATAKTSSPTSAVRGKAFDRLAIIWFENQNYDKAVGDPNFRWFAKQGITLSNYHAVTHPSQPNYMATVAGDYFGMNDDEFDAAPANVSTVVDLLESRDISWGFYQEDMPFSGYQGKQFVNQRNGANDYVRKHNPAVLHNSIASSERRLSQVKNLSMTDTSRSLFHRDLAAGRLPQWLFITPNMTSDGHDTSVTTAGAWCRAFLGPLLADRRFMNRTLVLITFDENETYAQRNRVLALLVGDALPRAVAGTEDRNFYNHFSAIAAVSANWNLPTLGRWDVGANVFAWVAERTGDALRRWPSAAALEAMFWNASYAGYFHDEPAANHVLPAPNLRLDPSRADRPILPCIRRLWARSKAPTYYADTIEVPDGQRPPEGYAPPA